MHRWTLSLAALLALVGSSTFLSAADAPRFQSLSPGGQSSAWVQQLNLMSEAERQERVRTFGMPPAPPNRWLKSNQQPQVVRSAPPRRAPVQVQQYQPARAPKPRPAVVKPKVLPVAPKAKKVEQLPEPVIASQPIVKPKPTQHVRNSDPLVEEAKARTAALRPIVKRGRDKPTVTPVVLAPQPKKEKTNALRRELTFMPRSAPARAANPYAPYANRAEYQRALSRTTWKPKVKPPQPNKFRFRWPFAKRDDSPRLASNKAKPAPKKRVSPAPASSRSKLRTSFASNGLPQPGRSNRRSVIETSLFPR